MERAYIRWAMDRDPLFVAGFDGRQHLVDAGTVRRLVGWLDGAAPAPRLDLSGALRPQRDSRLRRAQALIRRDALARAPSGDIAPLLARAGAAVWLNVGHDNLSAPLVRQFQANGTRTLALVHDTIPLDHPEFVRAGTPERFRAMLQAVSLGDGILCNSADTAARLLRHLPGEATSATPRPAPLGIDPPARATPRPGPPAFLCLGTIEPRKNHALLLDVWASMRDRPDCPHLRIAGRRGWRNEAVFRRLDDDPMIGRTVHEIGPTDDAALADEIASARAVLFPSLAEGYGLPLAEALAAGTPVIASDLPALREVGGDVPDWLSPHAPQAWKAAILDHARDPSPARDAQLARMTGWRPPAWEAHFAVVEEEVARLTTAPARLPVYPGFIISVR